MNNVAHSLEVLRQMCENVSVRVCASPSKWQTHSEYIFLESGLKMIRKEGENWSRRPNPTAFGYAKGTRKGKPPKKRMFNFKN